MRATRGVPRRLVTAACLAAAMVWPAASGQAGHGGIFLVLPVEYVKAQFDKGRKMTPIDLRSADAYRRGHLPGARSVPLPELPTRFAEVPTSDLVVLYCDCSPTEVEGAYRFLKGQSYRNLSMMSEGYKAWMERGYPIEQ